MSVLWDVAAYKARLDTALDADRWDEADRIRIATKRRLLEAIAHDRPEEIEQAREAIADSLERFRLKRRAVEINGAETIAIRMSADAETAGLAIETRPRFLLPARDAEEAIWRLLSGGNRRPMTTTELSQETGHRQETVARIITKLRRQGKVVSRRVGRNILHSACDTMPTNSLHALGNFDKKFPREMHRAAVINIIPAPDSIDFASAITKVTENMNPSRTENMVSLTIMQNQNRSALPGKNSSLNTPVEISRFEPEPELEPESEPDDREIAIFGSIKSENLPQVIQAK